MVGRVAASAYKRGNGDCDRAFAFYASAAAVCGASVAIWFGIGFDISGAKKQKGGGYWRTAEVVIRPGRLGGPNLWVACHVGCIGSFLEKIVGVAAKRLQPWPRPLLSTTPLW